MGCASSTPTSNPAGQNIKNINVDDSDGSDLKGVNLKTGIAPRTKQDRQKFLNSEDEVTSKLKDINYSACFNLVKFEMMSEISIINVNSTQKLRKIVCGASVNTEAAKITYPMDLICVLDDSGSMHGKKAELLRSSLKHLIKIIPEETRICLIKFSDDSQILTPFLRNTSQNKIELYLKIDGIVGTNTTNTESGMENALWMIKNRKYKNPITSIFLLTDGADNYTNMSARIKKLVLSYDIPDKFQVYSFGYGDEADHDEMEKISKNHKGQYTHIRKLEAISEWFILKFSESSGIIGFDVKIKISKSEQLSALNYGRIPGAQDLWIIGSNSENSIQMPFLEAGKKIITTFEVCCDLNQLLAAKENYSMGQAVIAFQGDFSFSATDYSSKHQMTQELSFTFKQMVGNEVEGNNSSKSYYNDLVISFQRAMGGDAIQKVSDIMKSSNPNYDEAKKILNDFESEEKELKSSIRKSPKMKKLMEDISDLSSKIDNKEKIDIRECKEMQKAHLQMQSSLDYQEDFSNAQLENATKLKNVVKVEEAQQRNEAKQKQLNNSSIGSSLALIDPSDLGPQSSTQRSKMSHRSKNYRKKKVEIVQYTELFGKGKCQ